MPSIASRTPNRERSFGSARRYWLPDPRGCDPDRRPCSPTLPAQHGLLPAGWRSHRKRRRPDVAPGQAVVPSVAVCRAERRRRLRRHRALHLDGLADTADGLLAHVPTKDRLEIMAEPGVGSFAAVALGMALLTRAAALAALEPSPLLLGALYCSSRSVMVVASRSLPYARPEGLVSAFLPGTDGPKRPTVRPKATLTGHLSLGS